jgi:hypothetical protein
MAELQVVARRNMQGKARDIAIERVEQIVKDVWQKVYNASMGLYDRAAVWPLKSCIPEENHVARFLLDHMNTTSPMKGQVTARLEWNYCIWESCTSREILPSWTDKSQAFCAFVVSKKHLTVKG